MHRRRSWNCSHAMDMAAWLHVVGHEHDGREVAQLDSCTVATLSMPRYWPRCGRTVLRSGWKDDRIIPDTGLVIRNSVCSWQPAKPRVKRFEKSPRSVSLRALGLTPMHRRRQPKWMRPTVDALQSRAATHASAGSLPNQQMVARPADSPNLRGGKQLSRDQIAV